MTIKFTVFWPIIPFADHLASSVKTKHTSKQVLCNVDTQQMIRDADAHRDQGKLDVITAGFVVAPQCPSESPRERKLHPNKNWTAYYSALERGDLD